MAPSWDCEVCYEAYKDYTSLRIDGCKVCVACVRKMFQKALDFEHEYPPRWHEPLHPSEFSHIFTAAWIEKYSQKEVEYKTPPAKRVYCQHILVKYNADGRAVTEPCGVFLGVRQRVIKSAGSDILVLVKCSDCRNLTCMVCDESPADCASMHDHNCPGKSQSNEQRTRAFLGLKRGKEWQQCPNRLCHRRIELSEACNHVICNCGIGFCFICGKETDGESKHWVRGGCPRYNQPGDADVEYDDQSDYDEEEEDEELDPVDNIRELFTAEEESQPEAEVAEQPLTLDIEVQDADFDSSPSYTHVPCSVVEAVEQALLTPNIASLPEQANESLAEDLLKECTSQEDESAIAMLVQADVEALAMDENESSEIAGVYGMLTAEDMNYDQLLWTISQESRAYDEGEEA